jgi:rRNA biogenesis protein RRP5
LTDVDDDFDRAIAKVAQLKSGQWIKAAIIDCVTLQDKLVVVLSLRDSDVNVAQGAPKDIRWTKMEDLKPGQLVRGFIRHHSSKGCFVQLAYNIVGRVMLRNLSDGFIQNVEETFPVGHLVTAKVINVENGQVELSLRESDLADRETIYSMLQSGLCLQGTVKNIQPFGIFVSLGLGITGLCHISTLEKENKYQIGECIWVQVSGVDKEKRRISLLPLDPMKVNERIRTLAEIVGISFHKDSAQHSSMYKQVDLKDSSSDDDSEFEEPQEEVLRVPENFRLEEDEFLSENQHNAGNSDDRSMMENSKTEQQSMEEYLDEEKELEFSLDEPQTEEDFERNILASPDDSSIWIRYMAYFVSKRQVIMHHSVCKSNSM